jgi:hypothetical protein
VQGVTFHSGRLQSSLDKARKGLAGTKSIAQLSRKSVTKKNVLKPLHQVNLEKDTPYAIAVAARNQSHKPFFIISLAKGE